MSAPVYLLLRCPFCGGKAETVYIRDGRKVMCRDCHASGPPEFNGRADRPSADDRAAEAWNRRVETEPASNENVMP